MKLSDVKGVVDKLIEKGAIPRMCHKKSYRYSYTRICQELDNLTVEDLPEHVDIFIGVCILENVSYSALDPLTRQSVDHIWSKIYRTKWNSWKYISVGSINDHIRIYRETMNSYELSLLSSFMYNYGCADGMLIYEIYQHAVISYAYNDYDKKTLIEIIQIMLQLMCIDILDKDITVNKDYAKQIAIKEAYPWNLLHDIGLDIADCLVIKNDIREGLTELIHDLNMTFREIECIKLRYIEMLSYEKIGITIGVTRERVRQIIAKSLRKLRHPCRLGIIKQLLFLNSPDTCKQALAIVISNNDIPYTSIDNALELVRQIKTCKCVGYDVQKLVEFISDPVYIKCLKDGNFIGELDRLRVLINAIKIPSSQEETSVESSNTTIDCSLFDRTIEELNLSIRSFNCLKKAGVNTVGDIVSMTEDDLMRIRNLGKKSYDEVIGVIDEMGLKLQGS